MNFNIILDLVIYLVCIYKLHMCVLMRLECFILLNDITKKTRPG